MQPKEKKAAATDAALLRQFVGQGRQAAFSALVSRYSGLVYSTCLRDVGNTAVAEDAAQAVFLLLARKAPTFGAGTSLAPWLYRTARLVSRNAVQRETRARHHEQRLGQHMAAEMAEGVAENELWEQIAPVLHAGLDALGRQDREAILLRFFDDRSLRETGLLLGLSEDAARMRVSRSLEKLRRHLAQAGVALPATALAALLTEKAVHAAPASFHELAIQSASGLSAPAGSASILRAHQLAQGATKTMWITKAVITASLVGFGTTGGIVGILHGGHPRPPIVAQNTPVSPPAALPGTMAGYPTLRQPKNQQKPTALAFIIKAQPPRSKLNVAVDSPPPLGKVAALLPVGTTFTGNVITLPNGTMAAIIKAKSDKEYEAEFLASTYTRDQLAHTLGELPASAMVSIEEPGGKPVIVGINKDRAIKMVQSLPSGTFVAAKTPTSTIRYPRIK